MESPELVASDVFVPPSVRDHYADLHAGRSYSHYSAIPSNIQANIQKSAGDNVSAQPGTPCVLGVDEAGRGPVIGPMVYGVFYLPIEREKPLLATTHRFDDSKVLTPAVRADLMRKVCTSTASGGSEVEIDAVDLYRQCGWAIRSLSAVDIGAGMLRNGGSYNLNAQAMDATVELIRGVLAQGVNVREIYVDTIGQPAVYQAKLQRQFPTVRVVVEKKADSLYPCVSAASVVAKVTRDVSCEMLFEEYLRGEKSTTTMTTTAPGDIDATSGWGSGYPSDAKCVAWLKRSMDPVFGWGSESRFSWGTLKDMLEVQGKGAKMTDWPDDADDDEMNNMKVSQFFSASAAAGGVKSETDELRGWYGVTVGDDTF